MSATVLVVKPGSLSAVDKKLLREGGVICVESNDPNSVRLINAEPQPLSGNDLFFAAMKALASDKYNGNTADQFVRQVSLLVKASNAAPTTPESN